MILADTDVLIDFLAGAQPVADQVMQHIRSDALQISAIGCFELLSGARDGKRGDNVRKLVAAIEVIPVDRKAATEAAALRQKLDRDGSPIGVADSLIAGIALANELPLLTRNRKHFEKVEGLKLLAIDQRAT